MEEKSSEIRKKLPIETEAKILTQCRRRCCLCYGLQNDIEIKRGQIAHLNKKRNDNRLGNLVFLCLSHHDQYDSSTSQSKNLTKKEVRDYKIILNDKINKLWEIPRKQSELVKVLSGKYIREGYSEFAQLEVIYIGNGRVKINGISFYGTKNESGPNMGELNFESDLIENKIVYSHKNENNLYRIFLEFNGNEIIINEESQNDNFGMNVSFRGLFVKVK